MVEMVRIGLLGSPAGLAEKGQRVQERLGRELYTLMPQPLSLRPRACAGRARLCGKGKELSWKLWVLWQQAESSEPMLVLILFL